MTKGQNKSVILVVFFCLSILAIKYVQVQLKEIRDLETKENIHYQDTMITYQEESSEEELFRDKIQTWVYGCLQGSRTYFKEEAGQDYDLNTLGFVCTKAAAKLAPALEVDAEEFFYRGCAYGLGYSMSFTAKSSESDDKSVEKLKVLMKKHCLPEAYE